MPFHEFVVTSVTATFTSLDMDDATEQGHDAWGYNHGQEDGTSETETERSASKGGSLLRETGHCTSGMARWAGERSRLKRKEIERRQQGNGICMTCRRDIRRQNDIDATDRNYSRHRRHHCAEKTARAEMILPNETVPHIQCVRNLCRVKKRFFAAKYSIKNGRKSKASCRQHANICSPMNKIL